MTPVVFYVQNVRSATVQNNNADEMRSLAIIRGQEQWRKLAGLEPTIKDEDIENCMLG